MEWKVRDLTACRFKRFSSLKSTEIQLGPPKMPFNGHRDFRPRVHRPWSEVAKTPGDEVKNDWSYYSIPRTCLHGVDRDNFIFLPLPLTVYFGGIGL